MRRILRFHSETFLLLVLVLSLCGVLSEIIYLLDRGRKRKEPPQGPRRRSKRLKAKQDQDEEEPIEPTEVAESRNESDENSASTNEEDQGSGTESEQDQGSGSETEEYESSASESEDSDSDTNSESVDESENESDSEFEMDDLCVTRIPAQCHFHPERHSWTTETRHIMTIDNYGSPCVEDASRHPSNFVMCLGSSSSASRYACSPNNGYTSQVKPSAKRPLSQSFTNSHAYLKGLAGLRTL